MARLFWTGNERLRFLSRIGWWLEAALLQLFWWIVTPLSPPRAASVGRRLLGSIGPRVAKHAMDRKVERTTATNQRQTGPIALTSLRTQT